MGHGVSENYTYTYCGWASKILHQLIGGNQFTDPMARAPGLVNVYIAMENHYAIHG